MMPSLDKSKEAGNDKNRLDTAVSAGGSVSKYAPLVAFVAALGTTAYSPKAEALDVSSGFDPCVKLPAAVNLGTNQVAPKVMDDGMGHYVINYADLQPGLQQYDGRQVIVDKNNVLNVVSGPTPITGAVNQYSDLDLEAYGNEAYFVTDIDQISGKLNKCTYNATTVTACIPIGGVPPLNSSGASVTSLAVNKSAGKIYASSNRASPLPRPFQSNEVNLSWSVMTQCADVTGDSVMDDAYSVEVSYVDDESFIYDVNTAQGKKIMIRPFNVAKTDCVPGLGQEIDFVAGDSNQNGSDQQDGFAVKDGLFMASDRDVQYDFDLYFCPKTGGSGSGGGSGGSGGMGGSMETTSGAGANGAGGMNGNGGSHEGGENQGGSGANISADCRIAPVKVSGDGKCIVADCEDIDVSAGVSLISSGQTVKCEWNVINGQGKLVTVLTTQGDGVARYGLNRFIPDMTLEGFTLEHKQELPGTEDIMIPLGDDSNTWIGTLGTVVNFTVKNGDTDNWTLTTKMPEGATEWNICNGQKTDCSKVIVDTDNILDEGHEVTFTKEELLKLAKATVNPANKPESAGCGGCSSVGEGISSTYVLIFALLAGALLKRERKSRKSVD